MNSIKVFVIKNEEGELIPGAGIWSSRNELWDKAVKDEWENHLSKKSNFQGCSLVKATLTEE